MDLSFINHFTLMWYWWQLTSLAPWLLSSFIHFLTGYLTFIFLLVCLSITNVLNGFTYLFLGQFLWRLDLLVRRVPLMNRSDPPILFIFWLVPELVLADAMMSLKQLLYPPISSDSPQAMLQTHLTFLALSISKPSQRHQKKPRRDRNRCRRPVHFTTTRLVAR